MLALAFETFWDLLAKKNPVPLAPVYGFVGRRGGGAGLESKTSNLKKKLLVCEQKKRLEG